MEHNNLRLRKRRDVTRKKTVFNSIPDFMADCGKDFFLDGEFPEGLEETHSKKFICQTYKNDVAYFATKFDTTRKTADFSAYKPNIGKVERTPWVNFYEHGTYISYRIYMHFSSHICWAFHAGFHVQQYPKVGGMRNKLGLGCSVDKPGYSIKIYYNDFVALYLLVNSYSSFEQLGPGSSFSSAY